MTTPMNFFAIRNQRGEWLHGLRRRFLSEFDPALCIFPDRETAEAMLEMIPVRYEKDGPEIVGLSISVGVGVSSPVCTFCGSDKRHLVISPTRAGIFICDECVGLCSDVFGTTIHFTRADGPEVVEPDPPLTEEDKAMLARVKEYIMRLAGDPAYIAEIQKKENT